MAHQKFNKRNKEKDKKIQRKFPNIIDHHEWTPAKPTDFIYGIDKDQSPHPGTPPSSKKRKFGSCFKVNIDDEPPKKHR